MTTLENRLQASDSCRIIQRGSRTIRVHPAQDESTVWSTEAASQDVIEGVEVAAPGVVDEESGELAGEAVEVIKPRTVDDENRLRIPRNPARGARLVKVETTPLVPLTADEVRGIADSVAEHVRAAVVLAAGTGLRQGELFGLTVDRIDFMRRELRVDWQLWTPARGSPILKAPKSADGNRTIALSPLVVDSVSADLATFGAGEEGLVFHLDGRSVVRNVASKYMRNAAAGAGVEATWHSLRHHHASVLLSAGVAPPWWPSASGTTSRRS